MCNSTKKRTISWNLRSDAMGNHMVRRKTYEVEPTQNQKPVTPRKAAAASRRLSDVIPDAPSPSKVKKSESATDLRTETAPPRSNSFILGKKEPPLPERSWQPKLLSLKEVRQVTTNLLKHRIYGLDKSPKKLLESLFPQPARLFNYRLQWVPKDLLSGLLVALIHFTQEFATAMTASLKPNRGLNIGIFPAVIYAVMASSPHNSLGAMPMTAATIGVSVMDVQEEYYPNQIGPGGRLLTDEQQWALHFQVSTGIAFFAGFFLVFMGLLKMGFLHTFLSPTVMDPFGLACMLQSLCAQFPSALGVSVPVRFTYGKHFRDIVYFISNWNKINGWEAMVSIAFASGVLGFREFLQPIIYRKIKLVIPIEFMLFVVAIGLTYALQLDRRIGIRVVGPYTYGLPYPTLPGYYYDVHVVYEGFFNAIVAYSVTLGSARTLARKYKDNISTNQELIALGCAHIFGSFFSSFVVAAPMGRGIINQSMGSRSQISTVVGCVVLGIIVAFGGPAISYLPICIISTTVILFLIFSLNGFAELPKLWKSNKFDAFVWSLTFVASVSLNVEIGLVLGLSFSLLGLIIRTQRPKVRILGRLKNSNGFVPLKYHEKAEELPDIRILQITSPLHYANAHYLLQDVTNLALEPYLAKQAQLAQPAPPSRGSFLKSFIGSNMNPRNRFRKSDDATVSTSQLPGSSSEPALSHTFERQKASTLPADLNAPRKPADTTRISQEFILVGSGITKASRVILELGAVGYIDAVGIRALEQLASDLKPKVIELILAQCKGPLLKQLRALELRKIIPERNIFPSLIDAVNESGRRIRSKSSPAEGTLRAYEDVRFWDLPAVSASGLPTGNYKKD